MKIPLVDFDPTSRDLRKISVEGHIFLLKCIYINLDHNEHTISFYSVFYDNKYFGYIDCSLTSNSISASLRNINNVLIADKYIGPPFESFSFDDNEDIVFLYDGIFTTLLDAVVNPKEEEPAPF